MTKTELITALSEKSGLTKRDTSNFLLALNEVIYDRLSNEFEVQIAGLGKFSVTERK